MDNNSKKEYLLQMFTNLSGEDIAMEEYSATQWFEYRGYSTDEAEQAVFEKYRKVLLRDSPIIDTIIRFDDIYSLTKAADDYANNNVKSEEESDQEQKEKYFKAQIEHMASSFCGYNFTVANKQLIDDPEGAVQEIKETYIAHTIVQGLIRQRAYKESLVRQYENLIDQQETKAERLGRNITPYGFLDLPKTKELSDKSKIKLIESIADKGVPYAIAMFNFLGFLEHLRTNHKFETQSFLCKETSKWLEADYSGRSVKGNLLTLNAKTEEDKSRYTAHKHIEEVKKDYGKLK